MLGTDRTDATWSAFAFTGPHRSLEPGSLQVADDLVADRPAMRLAPITATERGDSSRRTACDAAERARASMAASASGVGAIPRRTSTTPSANRVAVSKPACVKTPIILRFSGSTDAVKPGEADVAGPHGEVLQEHGGQAAPVVGVVDEEGHLRLGAVPPAVVAGHADELVAPDADERHPVDVVDADHAIELALGQPGPWAEVPVVDALRRLAAVERGDAGPVVRSDRPHVGGGAVGEDDIGLEVRRGSPPAARAATHPRPGPCRRTYQWPVRDRLGSPDAPPPARPPWPSSWRSPRSPPSCASEAKEDPLSVEGDSGFEVDDDLGDEIDGQIAPETGLDGEDAPSSDEVVQAALSDVDAFWEREYEDLYGAEYEPISGGFWSYGPDSEQPPCGAPPPDYSTSRRTPSSARPTTSSPGTT